DALAHAARVAAPVLPRDRRRAARHHVLLPPAQPRVLHAGGLRPGVRGRRARRGAARLRDRARHRRAQRGVRLPARRTHVQESARQRHARGALRQRVPADRGRLGLPAAAHSSPGMESAPLRHAGAEERVVAAAARPLSAARPAPRPAARRRPSGTGTIVEVLTDAGALAALIPDWEELTAQAAQPNPFYEHWMLLPAL